MGCCFSSCRENKDQEGSENETTHLLNDPVINSSSIQRIQSDDFSSQFPNSVPRRADEQSVLNKILQETATNVIDVAALGPHNIDQNEYIERKNRYRSKVGMVNGPWLSTKKKCLLDDIPDPERVLMSPPLSDSDYQLMKISSSKIKTALQELKIVHSEDLIVPFKIP